MQGDTTSLAPGFPIRTSSDHSTVDSSPRHIAASHVLHRLPVPRHPPCALKHLQHKKPKNEKKITLQQTTPPTPDNPKGKPLEPTQGRHTCGLMLATTIHKSNTTPHHQARRQPRPPTTHADHNDHACSREPAPTLNPHIRGGGPAGLLSQDPTVCLAAPGRTIPVPRSTLVCRAPTSTPLQRTGMYPNHRIRPYRRGGGTFSVSVLLRKEVIQPHLPVRLPCYDFVPIADPTFDSSLPQGVRPPASGVTDFHDVTGGVYKARERIHRSVADLRLLATPTSRGRVADPDPN